MFNDWSGKKGDVKAKGWTAANFRGGGSDGVADRGGLTGAEVGSPRLRGQKRARLRPRKRPAIGHRPCIHPKLCFVLLLAFLVFLVGQVQSVEKQAGHKRSDYKPHNVITGHFESLLVRTRQARMANSPNAVANRLS